MNQIVESRSFCVFISARKSLMYDFLILRDNMIKMESPYAFAFLAQQQTKTSIVDAIYKKTDHMLKDIHSVSDLFFSEMFQALRRGETIEIRGFGTFSVQFRKGRKGMRNPKTGELVNTEDHSVVVFRPGKILSAAVRPIVEKDSPDAEK